jgi:L-alanine-DL-glutamate epimerase-like enolase superfamily enzyme
LLPRYAVKYLHTLVSGGTHTFKQFRVRITHVRTAVIDGNSPWVLVRIHTDEGITDLGEAYWGPK